MCCNKDDLGLRGEGVSLEWLVIVEATSHTFDMRGFGIDVIEIEWIGITPTGKRIHFCVT